MTYVCIECGAEAEYADLRDDRKKLKSCSRCTERRGSNIWMKKRPTSTSKIVLAR